MMNWWMEVKDNAAGNGYVAYDVTKLDMGLERASWTLAVKCLSLIIFNSSGVHNIIIV